MKMMNIYNKVRRLLPLCAVALLASCGLVEIEHSENGKLDGSWHLVQVDTLSTGGTLDLRNEQFYWLVQGTVFELFTPWEGAGQGLRYVSHFQYEGTSLTIEKLYTFDRAAGDPEVEDVDRLRPYGINKVEGEAFTIEELSGGNMTLRGDELRLQFKKH